MTQVTPLYSKLMIASVDLTAYMNDYDIERTFKNRTGNLIKIYMNQIVASVATFNAGDEIILTEGTVTSTDYKVFRGKVWRVQPDDTEIVLTGRDRLHELGGDYFTVTYDWNIDPEAGVISAMFEDIVTESTNGYNASVVNSGTDIILKRFRSRDKTRLERLGTLAKILDWGMEDDYDNDVISFQPKGYTSFGTPLVVGANVFNVPIWDVNLEPMKNKIKIKGAFEEGTVVHTPAFTGDGSTDEVTLIYTPSGTTKVTNTTTSTELVRGISDSTDEGDYQVDEDLKTITFTTPPTAGHVFSIEYVAPLPKDVEGENIASIASTGVIMGTVLEFKDIQNVDDAETRLTQMLQLIGQPFISTVLHVNRSLNVKPGQIVNVTDPERTSFSGNYVVTSVKRNYTDPYIIVKIGDTDFDIRDLYETIDARLQAIEDAELADTAILRQIIQNSGEFINNEFHYEDMYVRDMTSTTVMYWDYPSSIGNWDNLNWAAEETGDPITDGYTLERRTLGNNTYFEILDDTDFYDSTNSTGLVSWNTSTHVLSLVSGIIYTNVIAKGTSYRYITVDINYSSLTFTLAVSADGKATWQTITPGVRTALTSSDGTGVYLRISASVFSCSTVPIATPFGGVYNIPAIEAVLEE